MELEARKAKLQGVKAIKRNLNESTPNVIEDGFHEIRIAQKQYA